MSISDEIATEVWSRLGVDEPVPPSLGQIEPGDRSGPLAITQLILLYHLLIARRGDAVKQS